MSRKKKDPDDTLLLVAGRIPAPVRKMLPEVLRKLGMTESEYVRGKLTPLIKRDFKKLAA